LRAAEVRSLRLADVDMGLRRVRVTGKGGKERVVPVDAVFFAELAAYLREERPASCRTAECFVVLRGPSAGQPLTEAGLRRIFRTRRLAAGALRVRPHRLRHTYGTELATAGIDLLALRELMGHANPETTAAYVHLSPETLAAEYARARAAARGAPRPLSRCAARGRRTCWSPTPTRSPHCRSARTAGGSAATPPRACWPPIRSWRRGCGGRPRRGWPT